MQLYQTLLRLINRKQSETGQASLKLEIKIKKITMKRLLIAILIVSMVQGVFAQKNRDKRYYTQCNRQ